MQKQIGFTLIELVTVVIIAALLVVLALPSFRSTVVRNRVTEQVSELVTGLNLARSEAVKRGHRVTVCPSDAAQADCDLGSNWSQGWLVFAERDDSVAGVNGDDEIIRVFDPRPENFSLVAVGGIATGLSYLPSGHSDSVGSFVVCEGGRIDSGGVVNLFKTGRAERGADTDLDRIPEFGNGNEITDCVGGGLL